MNFDWNLPILLKIPFLFHVFLFLINSSLSYRINNSVNYSIPLIHGSPLIHNNPCKSHLESLFSTHNESNNTSLYTIHSPNVRVRFAPSPTGSLHIGSLRTYICNYLFAKKHNGKLILRIDDTDPSRNVPGSLEEIISTLRWTGLEWDEGVYKSNEDKLYYQSNRNNIYKEFANKLVSNNHAYYCFCKESFISKLLQKWFNFKPDTNCNKCLNLTKEQIEDKLNKNHDYAIKLRTNNKEFDDFVLIRSNGCATYNFSSCVDDHLMNITHIIRGSDHLLNTNKHKLIFDLLNVKYPEFIHVPLILDENQFKLSKRSNQAFTIQQLIFDGICPLPLINYLALLGTKYAHDKQIYQVDELVNKFSLNLSNNNFNYNKLIHLNKIYLHTISSELFLSELNKYFEYINAYDTNIKEFVKKEWIKKELVVVCKPRVNTLKDYFINVDQSLSYNFSNIKTNIGICEEQLIVWAKNELESIMNKSTNNEELHLNFINLLKEIGESENKTNMLKLIRFLLTGETNGPSLIDMVNIWKAANEYNFSDFVNLKQRLTNILTVVK